MPRTIPPTPHKYTYKGDRKPWDRRVLSLQTSAKAKENHAAETPVAEWNMHLFRLQTPILTTRNLKLVIELDDQRIYPPFEIDRGFLAAQNFTGSRIPSVKDPIEFSSLCTSFPTISFEDHIAICYGLRVDLKRGVGADWDGLGRLLSLLRERSLQWWIGSEIDPFDLGSKYIVSLNQDGSFSEDSIEGGRASPWSVVASTKAPFGWETVVNEACWAGFAHNIAKQGPLETATTAFLDALSAYMSQRDSECIYRLCLSLEIMESKVRAANGKPTKAYALRLLDGAHLWQSKDKSLLKKLFTDRGHISHGSKAYYNDKDDTLIIEYLDLCKRYYERFLKKASDYGWDKISKL